MEHGPKDRCAADRALRSPTAIRRLNVARTDSGLWSDRRLSPSVDLAPSQTLMRIQWSLPAQYSTTVAGAAPEFTGFPILLPLEQAPRAVEIVSDDGSREQRRNSDRRGRVRTYA